MMMRSGSKTDMGTRGSGGSPFDPSLFERVNVQVKDYLRANGHMGALEKLEGEEKARMQVYQQAAS
jgi:hypothetical protein